MTHSTPIALTIAGSDSGGGAGIQADLKTFSALGVFGASVITALTAQNTREVRAIHDVPAAFIADQLNTVLDDLVVDAIKIGMLSRPETIETIAGILRERAITNIVLDPVMVAKSGDKLLLDEAVSALRNELVPLARLITPNLPEAAVLLGTDEAESRDDMRAQAQALRQLGPQGVLIKGGHLSESSSDDSADLLLLDHSEHWLPAKRIATRNTHGTGCTLSSAIAAGLARGLDIVRAVEAAKAYITDAIQAADRLQVGSGHGPTHHFHRWW
ncbi:Hydroxymethylpyrimidine phosphate kinase ThiD [Marinobacterium lacunae]|uniref:hydroxymethylpyrimidine kinase n=1 Tax=Marinobacterium lacunae TaxID=1232683 RepID=A0A081FVJ8_9GAMM|nr:bifunctional hydroxymethylpyrimidine kinase/phosphomethylpyrimidine kinase [Marinobacterium lacunae]KEA62553.1 Hydroxymethylpyrimidine phosphate kinase ThiD [Marinobacterium lacunae]MBR9884030.1 bifunctional hydroxymethylpyrimidine kinase/phosphomethylpyrimidine kinase [Oceanospirillales bacterium]